MAGKSLIALGALVLFAFPASAADYWGVKLANQPTQFIFGYGSLVNSASRNSTASAPIPAIPVRISAQFGFIRTWNDRSPSGFTALGLRKPQPGEQAMTINGVLYAVDDDDMTKFDEREKGYARVEAPREDIEAASWQQLPQTGKIWVYIPVKPNGEPGVGLPVANAEFPLLESYIDVVVEGGLEYGEAFARELIETTSDWSEYWLNDRELARRPWVRDPKSAEVDRLLMSTPDAAAKLQYRLFSEIFAMHWANERRQ
jgi:hypothetical protein